MSAFQDHELIELLSTKFNVKPGDILKETFVNNGVLNRVSGGDVYIYSINGKKIICKTITNDLYEKIGEKIDPDGKDGLLELWHKSPHRIRNSFMLEDKVYTRLDNSFRKYIPDYYESYSDNNRGVLFIQYIDDDNEDKMNTIDIKMGFLACLHNYYFGKESLCRTLGVYIPAKDDYSNSSEMYLKLLQCVKKYYPEFPENIIDDLQQFIDKIDEHFNTMECLGRTLCHGDFSHRNIRGSHENLKIFDWEGACFFNPEFDLLRFLSDTTVNITDEYITCSLNHYFEKINFRNKDEFRSSLMLNSQLYFFDSILWILLLRRSPDNSLPKLFEAYLRVYSLVSSAAM